MWRSRTRSRLLLWTFGLCAVWASGCTQLPRIDPTGEHLFVPPPAGPEGALPSGPYRDVPGPQMDWNDVALFLAPAETVAPIGSEMVLVAGVGGPDGYLRTGRRLEWSIAPGSVGHFVAVGKADFCDVLLGNFHPHKKIDNTYAVGSTSRKNLRLTCGTPDPADDVPVKSGEGWVSLTSPLEGTTQVNVVAPDVYGWDRRMKTARIHWVDASWVFPPPAINPAGTRHVFTTSVLKRSNQTPCAGWLVRYTITGGPPAGFAPGEAESIEVATNEAGQAHAEIFQKTPVAGTNAIRIEVIRPGSMPGADGRQFVLDTGTTMKTWTAASLAIKTLGPAVGTVGSTLTYRIEVSNPGDLPAANVRVSDAVPEGLSYLSSTPPAEAAGNVLLWRLGDLAADETRTLEVHFRAEKEGNIVNCADAVADGGLKVTECATTTVSAVAIPGVAVPGAAPPLDLEVTGPAQATVGSNVTFNIVVANRGPIGLQRLKIRDRFDPGLQHERGEGAIHHDLGELPAGQMRRVSLAFHVVGSGRLCHTVEVVDDQGRTLEEKTVYVLAREATVPDTGPTIPPLVQPGGPTPSPPALRPGVQPSPGAQPAPAAAGGGLKVQKTGPAQSVVGEIAAFSITIFNTGDRPLTSLQIVDRYDPLLQPDHATEGFRLQQGNLAWTLPRLQAGKGVTLRIQCRCMAASPKTVNRVTVTSAEGFQAEDTVALEIRAAGVGTTPPEREPTPHVPPNETRREETPPETTPPVPRLTLSVTDLHDPVNAGKNLVYVIEVVNQGAQAVPQVTVSATLPEGMVFSPLGTTGPNQYVQPRQEGKTVRFTPLFEIPPGVAQQYRLRVRPMASGKFALRVEVTSPALPQPLADEEDTTVN